jgi:transposase
VLLLPSSVRIFVAAEPIDLRKSIDGLAAQVRGAGHDVYSGHLFVFAGRRRDRIKILVWDRGGFVLYYKRLESGRFRWPEIAEATREVEFDATQLAMLLDGIDVRGVRRPTAWRPQSAGHDPRVAIEPRRWDASPTTTAASGASVSKR